jgi:hypothetical protein
MREVGQASSPGWRGGAAPPPPRSRCSSQTRWPCTTPPRPPPAAAAEGGQPCPAPATKGAGEEVRGLWHGSPQATCRVCCSTRLYPAQGARPPGPFFITSIIQPQPHRPGQALREVKRWRAARVQQVLQRAHAVAGRQRCRLGLHPPRQPLHKRSPWAVAGARRGRSPPPQHAQHIPHLQPPPSGGQAGGQRGGSYG